MSDIDEYASKVLLNLGFGEVGVNLQNDSFTYSFADYEFSVESFVTGGDGENGLPAYDGVGYMAVSLVLQHFEDGSQIKPGSIVEWLTWVPMFGAVCLREADDGGLELFAKQEIGLSLDLGNDTLLMMNSLDNLVGIAKTIPLT